MASSSRVQGKGAKALSHQLSLLRDPGCRKGVPTSATHYMQDSGSQMIKGTTEPGTVPSALTPR